MQNSKKRISLAQRVTYILLAVILFTFGLIVIRNFLFQIAIAFLLAYLLLPLANWLKKKGLPRVLTRIEPLKPYAYLLGQEGTTQHEITVNNLKNSGLYKFFLRKKVKSK